jgi:TonB family protein
MNANRDLIWAITLSLLFHGAFLGLPFSPGRQGLTLTHQSIPLEISLVKLKGQGDGRPKMKLAPLSQPTRVGQRLSISKRKVTKRREKWPVSFGKNPILKGKPIIPLKEETLSQPPEPLPLAPQRKGAVGGNLLLPSPLASAENQLEGEGLKTSLIPKGKDSAASRLITLAKPRYDGNPKPPYPRNARRRGYDGVVVLKVEILPNGRVGELRVKKSSGHHILDKSALNTVKKWKFIPAKRGEDPIRIWAEVPIKFELK